MNIYFVCTGNTCRSPMAAAILNNKHIAHITVRSAGLLAIDGGDLSPNAKQTLEKRNISYHHISHAVTFDDLQWADLVLTMTTAHRNAIVSQFPQFQYKTYTLKEYVLPFHTPDISDPFGGDLSVYLETFEELNEAIEILVEKLVESKV